MKVMTKVTAELVNDKRLEMPPILQLALDQDWPVTVECEATDGYFDVTLHMQGVLTDDVCLHAVSGLYFAGYDEELYMFRCH